MERTKLTPKLLNYAICISRLAVRIILRQCKTGFILVLSIINMRNAKQIRYFHSVYFRSKALIFTHRTASIMHDVFFFLDHVSSYDNGNDHIYLTGNLSN